MPTTVNSYILVAQEKWKLYELLKRVDEFPRYIAGVESVNAQRLSDHERLTTWKINYDGVPVRWVQRDVLSEEDLSIRFKLAEGDFATYEGEWKVRDEEGGTQLELSIRIDWGETQLKQETRESLDHKAKLAVRWMMRELRKNVGAEHIISIWPLIDLKTPIISERIAYANRAGKRIVGYYDHLEAPSSDSTMIVFPPGYGETKRDAIPIAYYLAKNGFRVVRYDATDHVGESEGDMVDITMTKQKDDLLSTLDYLEERYGVHRFAVIASSLAKLVAIKAAAEDSRICLLVGVVAVVNLRETLKAVYNEDMIGDVAAGRGKDIYEVLGFQVSQEYHRSAIRDRFHDLNTTIEDLQKVSIPVVFFVAENDAWVRLEDVQLVVEATNNRFKRELHMIPDAMHQLFENPDIAKTAMKQIVQTCKRYLEQTPLDLKEVVEPSLREIAIQNRLERDRLKKVIPLVWGEEQHFWDRYLFQYQLIQKFPDYKGLLDSVVSLLELPQNDSLTLLDAGCGVGHFGAWLIAEIWSKAQHGDFRYVGLDFVKSALLEAKKRHAELLRRFTKQLTPKAHASTGDRQRQSTTLCDNGNASYSFSYVLADLNYQLPFPAEYFDRICCNLVLSYLQSPSNTLKELARTLKPNGRIVITSLKPYADISQIYRNFISRVECEEDILEARKLLSCAGAIKQREGVGHYYFFSERSLQDLMRKVGLTCEKPRRAFGNQANVIVGVKET